MCIKLQKNNLKTDFKFVVRFVLGFSVSLNIDGNALELQQFVTEPLRPIYLSCSRTAHNLPFMRHNINHSGQYPDGISS